jgi:hypothetical protein
LFYSSVILPYRLLLIGYGLSWNTSSIVLCRFLQYINDLCPSISPYFVVIASIDRYCNSSTNIKFKKFNQISVAKWTTVVISILFIIFYLNTPIIIELKQSDGLGCRIRGNEIYNEIYLIIQTVILSVLAPFLMGLFGLMTIYNLKRTRIIPLPILQQRYNENQLIRMVLYQIIIHLILVLPLSIAYIMLLLPTKYSTMTNFYGVYTICYLPFYLSYGISFIVYVLADRLYRKEFILIVRKIFSFCHWI